MIEDPRRDPARLGGGLGSVIDSSHWSYVSPDIALQFTRPPAGEWLRGDREQRCRPTRHDSGECSRPFARGHQTLFIAAR